MSKQEVELVEKIVYEIGEDDFIQTFGRRPSNEEFEEFADLASKGLSARIDWNIVFQCAKDVMEERRKVAQISTGGQRFAWSPG